MTDAEAIEDAIQDAICAIYDEMADGMDQDEFMKIVRAALA